MENVFLRRIINLKISIMRRIDSIIIHCSATQAEMDFSAKDIDC